VRTKELIRLLEKNGWKLVAGRKTCTYKKRQLWNSNSST